MAKVTLPPIGNPENSSFVTELNSALSTLASEFDKVFYRDGTLNATGAVDLNLKRIYNLPFPASLTEPLRLGDVDEFKGTPGVDAENPNYVFAVNTLTPGTNATIDVTGTYPDLTITFGIPRGAPGASGALSDATYGDITVSGTGTILTVNNSAITLPKIQNITTARFLGRVTAGSGVVEQLTASQVKTALSLDQVNNTSDANKPISTATQTALNLKANSNAVAPAFSPILSLNDNVTLVDATHNNAVLKPTGAVTKTITLNGTPTPGFSCVVINRATVSWNISAASGVYKNGATSTVTTGTLAPGAQVTLIHEGSGKWSASGSGLT